MTPSNHQIKAQKLKSAKDAFNEYLHKAARPEHFLSVDKKLAPLRRMDGENINPTRQKFIGSRFNWNDTKLRWEVFDGSPIVPEDELWSFLSQFLSETDIRCYKKLSERLMEKTEGLLRQDVRMMLQIWKDYSLDQLVIDPAAAAQETEGEDDSEQRKENNNEVTSSSSSNPEPISSTAEAPSPRTEERHAKQVVNAFHPRYSDFLSVGTSGINGTVVYFAWRPLPGGRKPVSQFYTDDLVMKGRDELRLIWHPHLELDQFEGTQGQKGVGRRDFCRRIIDENVSQSIKAKTVKKGSAASAKAVSVDQPVGSPNALQSHHDRAVTHAQPKSRKRPHRDESSLQPPANPSEEPARPTAKRSRRSLDTHAERLPTPNTTASPARITVESEAKSSAEPEIVNENPVPVIIRFEPLTYEQVSQTILRVSASNQVGVAPASVPFRLCRTLDELFTTMISEYDIQSSGRISKVSATYTWNGKRHLLRRDRQEDWVLFCNAIKKAWTKEDHQLVFLEDGCEVDMMVHVD